MSVTSSELRKLAALNLSPEQMAGVLGLLADRVEADEARKAAQAERKRRSRDKNGTVTGQSQDKDVTPSPLVPPFPPAPPIPPIIPPSRSEIGFGAGELETKLREAAGWQSQPAPNLYVTGEIAALIAAGAILETDVLPVVKAHAPRVRRPSSWRYFVPIIQDAMQARLAAGTGPPKAGEVVPFANPTRSHNGPRPNTIAAGFDLIDRAIEQRERQLAAAQEGSGRGEDDPVALP